MPLPCVWLWSEVQSEVLNLKRCEHQSTDTICSETQSTFPCSSPALAIDLESLVCLPIEGNYETNLIRLRLVLSSSGSRNSKFKQGDSIYARTRTGVVIFVSITLDIPSNVLFGSNERVRIVHMHQPTLLCTPWSCWNHEDQPFTLIQATRLVSLAVRLVSQQHISKNTTWKASFN